MTINNNKPDFKLSYNAMMILIDDYANAKAFCLDREKECVDEKEYEELNRCPVYCFHSGRTEMAEGWLRVWGINPKSNIVQNRIKEYSQYDLTN